MRGFWIAAVVVSFGLIVGCGNDDESHEVDQDGGSGGADAGGFDGGTPGLDGSTPELDGGSEPDAGGSDGGVEPYTPSVAELDPEFGRAGLVTVGSELPGVGALWDVEVQSDGKLVAFGRSFEEMFVVRVTASGSLDRSFGDGGFVHLAWGKPRNGFLFQVGNMELDSQGRIVIASHMFPFGDSLSQAVVTRLTPDGQLDPTFADDGVYSPAPVNLASDATAVAVQSDDSIVFVLRDTANSVRRLTPSGEPDLGFGTAGQATPTFGGQATGLIGLTTLADDRIVFTGQSFADGNAGVGLGRLTADGAVDTSFGGGDGWVVDTAAGTAQPTGYNVAVAPDGDLLVAAARPVLNTEERASQFAVGRYSADGILDQTFGTDGWALEAGVNGIAFDVAVKADGDIVAVGTGHWAGDVLATVVGFDETGALDTDFAQNGYVQPATSALGVTLQPDGKIVTVGGGGFARYLPDGTLDPAFAPPTPLVLAHPVERVTALSVQPDGKILVSGEGSIGGGGVVMRMMPDGAIDTSFGDLGTHSTRLLSSVTPRTFAFDTAGRILVGGTDLGAFASVPGFRLARMSPEGVRDDSFGADGFAAGSLAEATAAQTGGMTLVDDDTIYLGGYYVFESAIYLGVLRIDSAGTVDLTWGDAGLAAVQVSAAYVTADEPVLIEVLPGGIIVAALDRVFRFDEAGVNDATFSVTVPGLSAIAADGDGFLTLAAVSGATEGTAAVELTRRLADGTLDPSFGTAGIAREELAASANADPMGLSIAPDGTIYVATSRGDIWRQDALTMRFDGTGQPDREFGDRGQLVMRLSEFSSVLHAVTFDATGRPIMAGRAWTPDGGSDFAVVRFR